MDAKIYQEYDALKKENIPEKLAKLFLWQYIPVKFL